MSYMLQHLHSGWQVDQAILTEEERLVVRTLSPRDYIQIPLAIYGSTIAIRASIYVAAAQCIRFGHDFDPECMKMDELLFKVAEDVKNFCVIYVVDTTEVPDFTTMYELYDPVTVMFFYRPLRVIICADGGTGNNNKINWAMNNKQELIDIIECIYRGARKGRGLVISPKDYSTKYRY